MQYNKCIKKSLLALKSILFVSLNANLAMANSPTSCDRNELKFGCRIAVDYNSMNQILRQTFWKWLSDREFTNISN